ncbi:MAG: lipoate--protein ligase [Bacteroidetes bacterium]|nr:lipoate--protein ligase [Bacteroidota bacterium]
MQIINRPQTDPYFNLAAEEYLLKSVSEDCFMLWRNEPSIIVGKHQNTLAEINYPFVRSKNLPVIRRISGGGTVFHDPGNINFTFIALGERDKLVDFRRFTKPIIEVLNTMGLPAVFEGKNDIRIKGLKISGNAEHVYKNKVLHHGTLLYNAQLNKLNEAIRVSGEKYADKSVQSIRSKVANVCDLMEDGPGIEKFIEIVLQHIQNTFPFSKFVELEPHDIHSIQKLADEKYKSWEWNFGYSPHYTFTNKMVLRGKVLEVVVGVEKGIIVSIDLNENNKKHEMVKKLEAVLNGKKHNFVEVRKIIRETGIHRQIFSEKVLMDLLF